MADLKLIALDAEDLSVISAHLQDAVLKVADLAYLPTEKRFAAIANRFDWADALKDGKDDPSSFARRRTALRFERVLDAKVSGIDLKNKGAVLSLLAIGFDAGEPPEGNVTLQFADGAAIRLARGVHRGGIEGPGSGLAGQVQAAASRRRSRTRRNVMIATHVGQPIPCQSN